MAIMSYSLLAAVNAIWKPIISLLDWMNSGIGNFGWTVVVFSIMLRLLILPLDIWQKLIMRKQKAKMDAIRPQLEKLQKQYANRPDILRQKQYELQKGSMNIFTSCLPMIFTLVIFGLVFQGFREYIVNYNQTIVSNLYNDVYLQFFKDNAEAISQACGIQFMNGNDFVEGFIPSYDYIRQAGLIEKLNETLVTGYKPESWLWVKNVFMSDTWANVIPSFSNFTSTRIGGIGATLPEMAGVSYDQLMTPIINNYNKTSFWNISRWNGYFILPVLSIATSFLSTMLQQKMQPVQMTGDAAQQKQQRIMNKTMTYLMPVVLGFFAIMYSAAFAIYYFVSNFMTMITSISFNLIVKNVEKKKQNQPIIIQPAKNVETKNSKKSNKAKR
ncbi:MAG: YidC/Oxa1 family membrane protein insertase [Clostridia bacterium]|nr:YidC/Oxa1 family membrane protein insertase [Clostridia bacterium]